MNCSRKPENLIFAEHTMETKQFPTAYLYHYNKTVLKNISLPINSSFNEILKQISDIIIDKSIQVDSEDNFEIYLGKSFDEDKIAIVLFHESDTISISFRTFGYLTKYLNHFKFLNYRNASETVKAKYGVKKTPKILAIIPQSIINSEGGTLVVGYEGIFIYHEIAKFFHNVFYLSTVRKKIFIFF